MFSFLGAHGDVEVGHGDACGAGAVDDDAHIADLFVHDFQRIDQAGAGNDGRAVLVIVEDRNVAALLRLAFDVEALRRLDVFEIDAAKGGRDHLDEAHDLFRVAAIDFDIEDVDVGEAFEENGLALHDGLGGFRTPVAQAKDGGAVADDGDEISLGRVVIGQLRDVGDFEHGIGDARRIGQGEVHLRLHGFGRNDLEFAGAPLGVVLECGRFGNCHGCDSLSVDMNVPTMQYVKSQRKWAMNSWVVDGDSAPLAGR